MAKLEDLMNSLEEMGYLTDPKVEEAFSSVDLIHFVPVKYLKFAYLDVPIPFYEGPKEVRTISAPHMIATLLQLLELESGMDVLSIGAKSGYMSALVAHLVEPGHVTVVEANPQIASITEGNIAKVGLSKSVTIINSDPLQGDKDGSPWDRVLITGQVETTPEELKGQLAELGFLLVPVGDTESQNLTKVVRAGNDYAELSVGSVVFGPLVPLEKTTLEDDRPDFQWEIEADWGQEALDSLLASGKDPSLTSIVFSENLDGSIRGTVVSPRHLIPEPDQDWGQEKKERYIKASQMFEMGYIAQLNGEVKRAEDLFQTSIKLFETAEAYTYLGGILGLKGEYEEAIAKCEKAIEVDPGLGNPYNDIGTYLIELERFSEAIPWLNKALDAARYDSPFLAHFNLGRAYILTNDNEKAKEALKHALKIRPDFQDAADLLQELEYDLGDSE